MNQDTIFDTKEGRFGLPAISITSPNVRSENGTEYLVDLKSNHWLANRNQQTYKSIPNYLSTAIEYKLYKLDSSYIYPAVVCLSNSKEIVESIQLNELNISKYKINELLRFLIEIYSLNWYYFCEKMILNKGLEYFFSRDEKSCFTSRSLFGDEVPQKLLDILGTDYENYNLMNPVFYLY